MASFMKRNGKWSVRFYIKINGEDVLKRLSGYDKKPDAEAAYFAFKTENEGRNLKSSKLLFSELILHYRSFKKTRVKESTFLSIEGTISLYLLPFFEKRDVMKLSKKDMYAWQNWLTAYSRNGKKLSTQTKKKVLAYLVNIFNYAVDVFDMPFNIATKSIRFQKTEIKEEMKIWTEENFLKFIKTFDIEKPLDFMYQTYFLFLYLTGTRRGESLALTWQDVNFEQGIVKITKSVTFETRERDVYRITTPKNASSVRTVYLPPNLVEQLNQLREGAKKDEHFENTDFVFYGCRPLPRTSILRKLDEHAAQAEIPRIRVHDLRHSHVSLLIHHGHSIVAIAKRIGHSNIEQTLNTYAHMLPSEQKLMLNTLNFSIN